MRAAPVSLGLLAALALTTPALADSVSGTRFDVRERTHTVDVRVDRGYATLVVTRTVENPGPKSDQATFHIDLPEGAVATRLRTAGTNARGETVWFEGDLMEAEAAAEKYRELTGIGGYYPKDPALLSWRSQKHLALQVFPILGRSDKKVEYTLKVPLRYEGGVYKATFSPMGTEELPATMRVTAAHPEDGVLVNGLGVPASGSMSMRRGVDLELRPRGMATVDAAVASVPFGADRVLVHARLDAAPKLGEVPARAAVAIVLDTSKSMRPELDAAKSAIRAYLASFPGAEVELVTFDRKVASPFGRALPARELVTRLYGFTPTLKNGSQLDDALARADQLLAASGAPVRRVLVLTDLMTRSRLTPDALAARTVASGAVVHVATVHRGHPSLERDDDSDWAKLPRKTGGLLWRASIGDVVDAETRSTYEEWVRPKRIQKLTVTGMPGSFLAPDELVEGTGLEHFAIEAAGLGAVTLKGELWSRPITVSSAPSSDEGKLWSALVFGSPLLGMLRESEMMPLALNGRAVSPVTSYLAIEPGVRPSTEGLELSGAGEGGGGRGEGIGLGSIGTLGHGGGTGSFDHAAVLRAALSNAMRGCNVHTGEGSVTFETTSDEIVDLTDLKLTPARDAKVTSCVSEALWAFDLPAAFVGTDSYAVTAKL
ncbi:MAG: VWA domain-containing protein [Myxococcales bacterium]|jgi:hypothetical protein|nr:VWA domain-containing protein [Myxococcales bacterium]